ncbi:MAG: endo-1,4-beta-xylanase, partial [Bacteroidales bacterium]
EVDTIVSWAEKADWYVRGHCLIWGGEDSWQLPSWIVADTMSVDSMYSACETRIRREVTRYAGEIHEYDVINEPYHETWLTDRTGDSVNWNAFNWARESDPDAKLFVNDFNIIVWPVVNEYVEVIREMLDNGAPIDGIGVQGHMENDIDWEEIRESLDSLSQFGLPITVTEFDMKVDQYSISEEDQADYYGQIMRIMFSYPLVKGFYFFGLYDKYAWREGSGIFNENKIPKIAADTVYHLIHEKWSTSLADSTEADGTCQFSGFYGDYEVTVKTGDSTVIFSVPFTKENESTEIELNLAVASPPHPKLLSVQTNADGSKIELEFDRKMNDPAANADKFSVYSIKELSPLRPEIQMLSN